MSGRGISSLPKPPAKYRIGKLEKGVVGFETKLEAKNEDAKRIKRCEGTGAGVLGAPRLARRLREKKASLASARHLRTERDRVLSNVWQVVDQTGYTNASTVTAIPRGWLIPAGQLHKVDPRRLIHQLRAHFYRYGAKAGEGFLIGFLHGEYDPATDKIQIHFHAVVSGRMRSVLDRSRAGWSYRHLDEFGRRLPVKGVRRSLLPLSNMPRPITYLLKSYWPSKWTGKTGSGDRIKQGRPSRIPDPRHTEVLVWLDRWSLEDIKLTIGVRASSRGFRLSG